MNTRTLNTKSLLPLPAILALAASPAPAQFHDGHDCGSHVRPEEAAQLQMQEDAGMYQLPAAADGLQFHIVRVKMHIVRQSNHTGGIDKASIWNSLVRANSELAASNIFLIPQDEVDYIDDDNFYFNINTTAEINALRAVRPQPKMLNIYFTENLANENGGLCGISSFTGSASQGIAMANSCTNGDSVLSHEIGHYWDLYHTHETAFGAECVSGSNCSSAGDKVCDTPADPGLIDTNNNTYRVNAQCQYIGGPMDPCAAVPYAPDTTNTMSYTYRPCMNHFTAAQSTRAQATLLNGRRSHLVASPDLDVAIHLDVFAPVSGNGAWTTPINEFHSALAATPTGGVLAIARAPLNEGPVTLNRKMVIYNSGMEPGPGGPPAVVVRIGAP